MSALDDGSPSKQSEQEQPDPTKSPRKPTQEMVRTQRAISTLYPALASPPQQNLYNLPAPQALETSLCDLISSLPAPPKINHAPTQHFRLGPIRQDEDPVAERKELRDVGRAPETVSTGSVGKGRREGGDGLICRETGGGEIALHEGEVDDCLHERRQCCSRWEGERADLVRSDIGEGL